MSLEYYDAITSQFCVACLSPSTKLSCEQAPLEKHSLAIERQDIELLIVGLAQQQQQCNWKVNRDCQDHNPQ